jgi:biopolymer transport protein ExbD
MRFFIILAAFFILTQGCKFVGEKDPNPIKVKMPEGSKPNGSRGKNVLVKVTADDRIFVGDKELPVAELDSLLAIEINKKRKDIYDTLTVVLNVDSAASYGIIFRIMKAAKRESAKVVAMVKSY